MKDQVIVSVKMGDLFGQPIRVFYYPKADNFLILNPPSIFFFATIEGSNGRKLAVNLDSVVEEMGLIEIGDL